MSTHDFPNGPQKDFAKIDKSLLPGDLWEGELFTSRYFAGLIAHVTPVALEATITIAANNPGDLVGTTVNGGTIPVEAGANADATAALLGPALLSAGFTDALLADAVVASNVITVTGVLGENPVLVEFSPDTTTATVLVTQAASVQQQLLAGMGVVRDVPTEGINTNKVRKPTSSADVLAGVISYSTHGASTQDILLNAGYDPNFLPPARTQPVVMANAGLVVDYIGDAPIEGDPVYWIFSGPNAGLWSKTDGGVSQLDTITAVSVADGNIGFNYDALPPLVIVATAVAATDADALADLWNGNAAYAAVGAAVGNGTGTISVAFSDTLAHVLADLSTGTSTTAAIIDLAAVAANAKLTQHSWGMPSITAAADEPQRGFMRMNP